MDKNEAIGYMILAMQESGIVDDKELVKTMIRNMAYCIDKYTEEFADNQLDKYL